MAILPRAQRRVVEQAVTPAPIRASQTALGDFATGLDEAGDALARMQDRLDTARAKEADTAFLEGLNDRLYNPDTGYLNSRGRGAVEGYEGVSEELDALYEGALEGLSPGARRKAESAIAARRISAISQVQRHAGGQQTAYLDNAGRARVSALVSSAIYDPANVSRDLRTAEQEVLDIGARNGWSPEQTEAERLKVRDQVHGGVIERIANVDPAQAMDYLADNRDQMSGEAVARLEADLVPLAKERRGRDLGTEAFAGLGNMGNAWALAGTMQGMSEVEQNEAIQEYLRNGGVNMDPAKVAWCAAFLNATFAQLGIEGTDSNMARSFLEWGVEVSEPQLGDVVVLRRDGPGGWEGHVGLFQGFDDNGSILLLGGNQSDSVNVQAYGADDLLGYRRAVKGVNERDAAVALQGLLQDIDDPVERQAAVNEFNARTSAAMAVSRAEQEQARDAAFRAVETGENIDDLPSNIRTNLGREAMSALRTYQSRIRADRAPTTDEAYKADLLAEYSASPASFARREPLEWLERLSPQDYGAMLTRWTQARQGVVSGGSRTNAPRELSYIMARANDILPDGVAAKGSPQRQMFVNSIVDWADANPEASRDDKALNDQMLSMLTRVVIDPSGLGNKQDALLFEIDFEGDARDLSDDMSVADLRGLRIAGNRVPDGDIDAVVHGYLISQWEGVFNSPPSTLGYQGLREWAEGADMMPSPREIVEALVQSGRYE